MLPHVIVRFINSLFHNLYLFIDDCASDQCIDYYTMNLFSGKQKKKREMIIQLYETWPLRKHKIAQLELHREMMEIFLHPDNSSKLVENQITENVW